MNYRDTPIFGGHAIDSEVTVEALAQININKQGFEWVVERQRQYDMRAEAVTRDRTGPIALSEHKRIVAEIDALPVEQGGRVKLH